MVQAPIYMALHCCTIAPGVRNPETSVLLFLMQWNKNTKTMIYIGIDNGISGGIALVDQTSGQLMTTRTMPNKKARGGNEVDVRAFHLWLTEATGGNLTNAVYILEEPGGSKSAKAAKSMAGSFHAIRGFFETKMLRWERITPAAWQKVMLPGCKAGETKLRALSRVAELWPEETFLASDRSRVPHDGLIDAALIAEFGRRKGI